jgi:hypothetical protein
MNQPLHLDLNDPEDQKVALGHLLALADEGEIQFDEVDALKERLIDKAENISAKLEAMLKTDYLAALSERDQKKARHRFKAQCKQLESKLNVLLTAIEGFQLHSY